jgi:hypothetical protein
MSSKLEAVREFEEAVRTRDRNKPYSFHHIPHFERSEDRTTRLLMQWYQQSADYQFILPIFARSLNKWSTIAEFNYDHLANAPYLEFFADFLQHSSEEYQMHSGISFLRKFPQGYYHELLERLWKPLAEQVGRYTDMATTLHGADLYVKLSYMQCVGKTMSWVVTQDIMALRGEPDAWDEAMPSRFVNIALNWLYERRESSNIPKEIRDVEVDSVRTKLSLPSLRYTSRVLAFYAKSVLSTRSHVTYVPARALIPRPDYEAVRDMET